MQQKRELRKQIIKMRDQLPPEAINEKSHRIAEKLYSLPIYRNAPIVMFFLTFGSEVNTQEMVEETIRREKVALAPKAIPAEKDMIPLRINDWDRDLKIGAYNIPEPKFNNYRIVVPEAITLLIVPGVAFDLKGNRLGYGGGYYDRFFYKLDSHVPLVALAFELQIVPEVPVDEWDRPVDTIITEDRIIEINPT
ncbi:MAG: 5-formyltetrahydrofolate cyclo-ligase [Bacillota bacterium]|nr:5-formyltetrahydrofolate cyclo-ligase [Bacillota bacterium]